MRDIKNIFIVILFCFIGVILFLRMDENSKNSDKIEFLQNQQRFNLLEIDSLAIGSQNQNTYINELEGEIEDLDLLLLKRLKRATLYKKKIKDAEKINYRSASDSVIIGIFSEIHFDT